MKLRWSMLRALKALGVDEPEDLKRNLDQPGSVQPVLTYGDVSENTPPLRAPASFIGGFSTITLLGESCGVWIRSLTAQPLHIDWMKFWSTHDAGDQTALRFAIKPLVTDRFTGWSERAGAPYTGQDAGSSTMFAPGADVEWSLGKMTTYVDREYDPLVYTQPNAGHRKWVDLEDITIPPAQYLLGWLDSSAAGNYVGFAARVRNLV